MSDQSLDGPATSSLIYSSVAHLFSYFITLNDSVVPFVLSVISILFPILV